VLFHGIVRDIEGKKMSKSLGNGIDPLEVIERYGADALRISLIMGTSPGSDSRFNWEKTDSSKNFLNKIWNAARFILMFDDTKNDEINLTNADKWILSSFNKLSLEVTENINNYELGIAVSKVYSFIWDEFCDWYIEMVKPRLYDDGDITRTAALKTLKTVFIRAMKLLHPFMPFITEEVFTSIQDAEESILVSRWPFYSQEYVYAKEEAEIELIKNAVRNIRNIRAEMNVAAAKKIEAVIVAGTAEVRETFALCGGFFKMLAGVSKLIVTETLEADACDYVTSVIPGAIVYLPLAGLIDIKKELERLGKEKAKLEAEIARAESKLTNEGFLAKAPKKLVEEETEKLEKYRAMLAETNEHRSRREPSV
jgi:valyl-tRNA synthetase